MDSSRTVMATLSPPPLSLYVHFPWCVSKCPYCDFNSYTLNSTLPEDRYVAVLDNDLQNQAAELPQREVSSIFLGGGTPSLFAPDAIGRVLESARRHLLVAADVEVTMEANPGTIERGRFAEYRAAGVNRVSLGAQSFDAGQLQALGRIHSPDETCRAAAELHAAGLQNFNLDLMYGLPEQDVAGAVADLDTALSLEPAHISHYQLTLEPGTVFAAEPPALPDDDSAAEMLDRCSEQLAACGFGHYEISAYAPTARRCRHNLNYWAFGDYLGIGAGAHGKVTLPAAGTVVRTVHPREPRRYLEANGKSPSRRAIPQAELPFEFMLNALRQMEGFEVPLFAARTGLDWTMVEGTIEGLIGRELLQRRGSRILATRLGQRFLNDVLVNFLAETPRTSGEITMSTAV